MHSILPFLLAMIAAIVLLEMLATRLKVAYPIILVIAGLISGFIPGLPSVKIDPDLIFFIFLPPLLFEACWSISFKEMKKWYRIITSFAFLVVFFTAFSVAIVADYAIPGFTIALGFLLGGIVSPPDAVSTGAITRFVKIPRSTRTILEGESLLNDATSLIIFRFALISVGTGQFIWQEACMDFLWIVSGGCGIGLLSGWLFVKAHRMLPTEAASDIALTIIEPYFMYWAAEQLHCSGVLAVVCGGLYMANKRLAFLNSGRRVMGYSVWETLIFILNGIVFLIIGLQLPEIVKGIRADGVDISSAIGYGILITAVIILARIISSYAALITTLIFRPKVLPRTSSLRSRLITPLILGWTGMRGVVSLAAALAIPFTINGAAFPHRNLILFVTFIVILLTLTVQGLTLPMIIRSGLLTQFMPPEKEEEMKHRMIQGLKQHVSGFLKNKHNNGLQDHEGMKKLLLHWESKTNSKSDEWLDETTRAVYFEMLESQRQYLMELNKEVAFDEELIWDQLYQIDLEEERVKLL